MKRASMKFARFALAALAAGALLAGCGPQVPPVGNYATIQGTVNDAVSGQPIAGAVVTVSVISSNATSANGFYKVYPVPTGPYTSITATAPGHQAYSDFSGGTLAPGQVLNVNISMQPGS
jgi:hypothetical protein